MRYLGAISRWIDLLNEWIGRGTSLAAFGLVWLVFCDVIMRYFISRSFVWVQEMEWHLFSLIFLFGAGYTLRHDGHVRVDIIYQRLKPNARAWVDLFGVLLFLLPGCGMVIVSSFRFFHASLSVLEGSPDPGGLPCRFLIKGAITAGFALLFMQGISMGIHSLLKILGEESHSGDPS